MINSILQKRPIDVIGIGNAIVDILVQVDDNFLQCQNLIKGSMSLINEQQANELYKLIAPGIESSGGSAANTIASIAQLGCKSGFIGRVRDDQLGEVFKRDICTTGAIFTTPSARSGPPTARCIIFVTPDAQRTMCTYLGTSVQLQPDNLDLSIIGDAKVLYLEGYLWDHELAKKAFITASKTCKRSKGIVALSLSDSFCVERHRESFLDLIENYVDILFANESEILTLFKSPEIENVFQSLRKKSKISVITLGEKGSLIITEKEKIEINPFIFGPPIDTTGAGDIYAGAFLSGYTKGLPLNKCGRMGSICAGHIVRQIGPRSSIDLNQLIEENI